MRPWRPLSDGTEGGVELAVRLTPRAGRSAVEGLGESEGRPVLRVRVTAPPVENAANAALVATLASALGLPKTTIRLTGGQKGRVKTLRIDAPGAASRLEALVGTLP
jgi:uncharacterized protein YggU (UPF0235/DUF167 family)